jgi:putative signal transducing protein
VYCPQCHVEYRDGFSECTDCRVPLVAELPPAVVEEHDLRLVTVLETEGSVALRLAKAALEEAGIEYLVSSDEALRQFIRGGFGMSPDQAPYQTCRIQVAAEYEAEARALLEPLANPDPAVDAEAEPDDEG